jgi:hypothetical protein
VLQSVDTKVSGGLETPGTEASTVVATALVLRVRTNDFDAPMKVKINKVARASSVPSRLTATL